MRLITELTEDIVPVIEESVDGKKDYSIEGIFIQAEKPNRNKRIYPKSIIEREVERYTKDYVNTKRAIGELGHPNTPTLNLDRVSHLITELRWDGNDVVGKAKILDTPSGQIIKNLLDGGVKLGVSTRGLGSVKMNQSGVNEVQKDFHLTTVDVVADPSGIDCFVDGIMEGFEWLIVDGKYTQVEVEQVRETIKKASSAQLQEAKIQAFQSFLNKIKN